MKSTPTWFIAASLVLLALPCFQANLAFSATTWSRKVSQSLKLELIKNPIVDIIVSTKVGTSSVLKQFNSETPVRFGLDSKEIRIESLVSSLEQNAEKSQKEIIDFLSKNQNRNSLTVKSLWISNQIVVKNADKDLIASLAQLDEVAQINLDEIIDLVEPTELKTAAAPQEVSWGVEDIGAPEVWKETAGEGVIVATIDSGVRWTHEALKDNYIGEYGWFDPYMKTRLPNDQNGHGTHTTGTIAGSFGIGVAPNVTWMSCKGCDTSRCTNSALLQCGEFITCPTLWDGSARNCSRAPNIVSNSWGGDPGSIFYNDVIAAWHLAGIIPVFANGNEGASCGTANSPADSMNDVIAVGATTETEGLATFSSRGPAFFDTIKPDVSAPGTNILSAHHLYDDMYSAKQGTSMACPHVAGVIALLKSSNPDITYEEVKSALFNGASRDVLDEGGDCGGIRNTVFPNNGYGHGRVDAVNTMLRHATPPPARSGGARNIILLPPLLAGNFLLMLRGFIL